MDENLRDQVHKWRDERKQKMMQRITNNSKTQLSSAVLGVKPSSSSTITLPQSNKEKRLPKKPPTEIRQTKTSAKRRLLANPLLEPKNVEFIQEMQRRDTLCVEKSQKDGSKVTVRDTHKEQTLKAICQYDLNGRRLTVSTNDLSKLGLAKRAFAENPIGAIVKCKNSEIGNNTNSKRNGSTERGNTYSAKQHRRSQSWQDIRSISVAPKGPRLCNNELAEFEQQYCKTYIEESQLPDRTNTLSNNKRETMILRKGNLPSSNLVHESRRTTFVKTSSEDHKTSVPRGLPRQPNCSLSATLNGKKVSMMQNRTSASVNRRKVEKQLTVRRSLSQEHLQRKKLTVSTKRRSSSTEDLNKLRKQVRFVSPIIEETSSLLLVDSSVPASGQSGRPSISTPCNSSSNLHSREQKRKLLKWLSEKGKPLDTFRHLQCFNISGSDFRVPSSLVDSTKTVERNRCPPQIPEEEACGLTVEASFDEGNKENICNTPAGKKELDEPQLKKVTCEALIDLRGLVAAGYDHDECEAWMELLIKRCPKICDYVEYWECLASLDEARGDYNMAVDCYQRAIVRGAEVDDINKQLDSLLSKMDDLNLETPSKDRTASPRSKVDIKNICKSKVIQFALQQKVVKRLGEDLGVNTQTLYVATPVRRSTRKSLCDPRCLKTLDDLDPEKKYLTEFQPNPALK